MKSLFMTWNDKFLELFRRCLSTYQSGNQDFMSYYTPDDLGFLSSIGYKPRELFDFIEDLADDGTPSESTALLVAAVRRDYFLVVQQGQASEKEITSDDLPSSDDALSEFSYLPRLLAKAEAKLRGELHPDLMFSCGGARRFLREHGDMDPADFLRHVWAADGDYGQIVALVQQHS